MENTAAPQSIPTLGITLGDYNGIGPEIILKTLKDNRLLRYAHIVVYGHSGVFAQYRKLLNMEDGGFHTMTDFGQLNPKKPNLIQVWEEETEVHPGKAESAAGVAAAKSLAAAVAHLKEGKIQAVVTAPINKSVMPDDLFPYPGHTEYFAQEFGVRGKELMILAHEDLRITVATTHIPLVQVAKEITTGGLEAKIAQLNETLRKDFGIAKPRIAVLGLNPHAGENGKMGKEDDEVVAPAIKNMKGKGLLVSGPFPADGFFGARTYTKTDAVLALYHDQGLVPFKVLAFDAGVNYTGGLPIVRTSPDHGTAYNLAGKNEANPDSLRAAIFMALDVWKNRQTAVVS